MVKALVEARLGASRAGIMLGLQRLGLSPSGFLGGYFVTGSNAVILNRDVLDHVKITAPEHHNAYAFHVLLHEYLHTLGYFDETHVRTLALEISLDAFGEDHPATWIAQAMTPGPRPPGVPELFRKLTMPPFGWKPQRAGPIEYVPDFDLDASPYIA